VAPLVDTPGGCDGAVWPHPVTVALSVLVTGKGRAVEVEGSCSRRSGVISAGMGCRSGCWRTGIAASFHRFIGVDSYDLTALRADLARFTFLLGCDDGEQLFDRDRIG
jgi:hypothetical protein